MSDTDVTGGGLGEATPLPAHLFKSQLGDGWSSHATTLGPSWDELAHSTQQMFLGVALGWWEDVDIKRSMPIPFPKVLNICHRPNNWTMAHALHELEVFDSISRARKEGWTQPLKPGEFWLKKRTVRVLLIWVEDDELPTP